MSPAVAEIERRLARITRYPHPWHVVESDGRAEVHTRTRLTPAVVLATAASVDLAEFFAHAPSDLDHLLKRVQDLEEQNAELRADR